MKLISVKPVREGEEFPRAIIGFHELWPYKSTDDQIENSHYLRIAIPLFHCGKVWNYASDRYKYGFKWLFFGLFMNDILMDVRSGYARHFWDWDSEWHVDLMR